MDVFVTQLGVYAYVKMHHIVHFKLYSFLYINYTSLKLLKNIFVLDIFRRKDSNPGPWNQGFGCW